jgi:MFS family permease
MTPGRSLALVRRFALGRGAAVLGMQIVSVAVGWYLYDRTGDPWKLGLVGLVEVVPVILLLIPAGLVSDRFPRRDVSIVATLVAVFAVIGLAAATALTAPLWLIYAWLTLLGVSRAFGQPASGSYVPELMTPEERPRLNALIAASYEAAAILGPATAGLLIAATRGAAVPLALAALGQVGFVIALLTLPRRAPHVDPDAVHSPRELLAGVRFIRSTPVFLAAITLDLLAVLLAGSIALLPVYAKDILHVGPAGLGWLRTAPSLGALLMSLAATRMKPWRRPGRVLLLAVAGFGFATVGFGLSRSFWLSIAFLFLVSLFDMISVIVRMTLEQNLTPDGLRGRVSAINYVFVGLSNELGAFESGAVAALIGPVATVVGGGIAGVVAVLAVAWAWPQLAAIGPLHTLAPPGQDPQP